MSQKVGKGSACLLALLALWGSVFASASSMADNGAGGMQIDPRLLLGQVLIEAIAADPRGGRAYRLRYVVDVPRQVYWRFKTDFDNDFLLDNRFIEEHRVLTRFEDTVVTENRYTHSPGAVFRWKTTVDEHHRVVEFILLNPKQCGQRFHYGRIRATAMGARTLVVQEAYFDFFGADIWAQYPWSGGMHDFLEYTARWEQITAQRLRRFYEK